MSYCTHHTETRTDTRRMGLEAHRLNSGADESTILLFWAAVANCSFWPWVIPWWNCSQNSFFSREELGWFSSWSLHLELPSKPRPQCLGGHALCLPVHEDGELRCGRSKVQIQGPLPSPATYLLNVNNRNPTMWPPKSCLPPQSLEAHCGILWDPNMHKQRLMWRPTIAGK